MADESSNPEQPLPEARAIKGADGAADAPADPPERPVNRRELGLVIAISLAVLLPGLASFTLVDPWEGHYGEVARRMLEDDDWVKLQWQNEAYFRSKPGLTFWLMGASMELHGVATDGGYSGEMVASAWPVWALRLPFALFGAFGMVMLWYMLARLTTRRLAWLSFGILATTPFYTLVARQAITDMPMVATAAGAIACFFLAINSGDRELRPIWKKVNAYHLFLLGLGAFVGFHLIRIGIDFAADPSTGRGIKLQLFGARVHPAALATVPFLLGFAAFAFATWVLAPTRYVRQVFMYWAYFLVGISVLAKGPPGAAVVAFTCALYVVLTGKWQFVLRSSLLQGLAIMALAAVPWHFAMYLKDGAPWASEYFYHHWWKRGTKGVHGETGTFNFFAQQLGIGMWPWIGLVPIALASALSQGVAVLRRDRVRVGMAVWAVAGFALFSMVQTKFHHYVLPAVPAFCVLVAYWIDDILENKARGVWLGLLTAVAIILFISRDLIGEQKQLIELFIYRYDRPWPEGPPWRVDVGDWFFWFSMAFSVALFAALVRPARKYALAAFGVLAIGYGYWAMNGYMGKAAPHWGQGALHKTYFSQRSIQGVDIVYYGLRDLADDWATRREMRIESYLPTTLKVGDKAVVDIEVPNVDHYVMNGEIAELGDNAFTILVSDHEVQRVLGEAIERGKTMKKPRRRKWMQVRADRLIAWQLNWRGENFWQAGDIWGRTKDTQTVFVKTDNKEFLEYLKAPERQGRTYWVITESGRADGLKSVLPTPTAKQTVEKVDTSCNKFTLLRFTL